jgi:hypothetical protein
MTAIRTKDPTAAARARRYRERKRHAVRVTAPRRKTGAPSRSVTLTALQQAALDALVDAITEHGEQPGPWPDHEPAAPLELWRTKVRTIFADHANARQMVRRTVTAMVRLGVVLERAGMVAVGTFGVDIKVAGST